MSSESFDQNNNSQLAIEAFVKEEISDGIDITQTALTDHTLLFIPSYNSRDINHILDARMQNGHEFRKFNLWNTWSNYKYYNGKACGLPKPGMLEALGRLASFNSLTEVNFVFDENNHKILPELLERLSKNPSITWVRVRLYYENAWQEEGDLINALAKFKHVSIGDNSTTNPLKIVTQISHSRELESLNIRNFGKLELPKGFKWPQGTNLQKLCIIKLPFAGIADTCVLEDILTFHTQFPNLYHIDLKQCAGLANTDENTKMLVSALKKLPKLISLGEGIHTDICAKYSSDGHAAQTMGSLYQHVTQNKQRLVERISDIFYNQNPMHESDLAILRTLYREKMTESYDCEDDDDEKSPYDKMFPNIGDQIVTQYLDTQYYNQHILGGWKPQTHTCDASTQTETPVIGDALECDS